MTLLRKNIIGSTAYKPGRSKFDPTLLRQSDNKIQLSSNTNIIGPSPKVIEAIANKLNLLQHYPDPNAKELKNQLAKKFNLNSGNFLIGNGSAEIIDLINHAYLENDNEILTSLPTFPKYHISARICNSTIKTVDLKNSYHDIEAIIARINKKTKVIFVDTPNNPTGSALRSDEIDHLVREVPSNVILVIDEAYHEFNKFENFIDYTNYIDKKNVLFLRSFSKAYGIAGLRVGYMIGNSKTINDVNRVREVFNVNCIGLSAAEAALNDYEHLRKNVDLTSIEKKYLYDQLNKLKIRFYNSEANFILINTERDIEAVDKFLLNKGVIVRPIKIHNQTEGHIRVTIGTPDENKYFIDVLQQLSIGIPKIK